MNQIILHGRIANDIELKTTASDVNYCSFSVAVDRGYGEEKLTDFIQCKAWRKTAEFISKYFIKGKEILINGELQSSKYEDADGNKKTNWYVLVQQVEFCGSNAGKTNSDEQELNENNAVELEEINDEDLPF